MLMSGGCHWTQNRSRPLIIVLKTVETSFLGEEGVMAVYALRMSDIVPGYRP